MRPDWEHVGTSWSQIEPSWVQVGLTWANLGSTWPQDSSCYRFTVKMQTKIEPRMFLACQVGGKLVPSWAKLGPSWG